MTGTGTLQIATPEVGIAESYDQLDQILASMPKTKGAL